MNTPVALIIFNRPETTRRVFAEIRRVRPPKLFIIADGPRSNLPGDADKVAATRSIVEEVDWNCQVLKNYSDINLGCKNRVSSGIDWVFENVNEATILEDDCLPHPTFFRFCEEMLERYRNDNNIMHITGDNFQFGLNPSKHSYYFSRYAHVWGWATWKRSWLNYDVSMEKWGSPQVRKKLLDTFEHSAEKRYWAKKWDDTFAGRIDTWDYQWAFACMFQGALSVTPNVNLISNIGFGESSTHTQRSSLVAEIKVESMEFPLKHPNLIERSINADLNASKLFYRLNLVKYIVKLIWLHIVRQPKLIKSQR